MDFVIHWGLVGQFQLELLNNLNYIVLNQKLYYQEKRISISSPQVHISF